METEPTTLAEVVRLIAEVLKQDYGIDPLPLFEQAGIDSRRVEVSGARVSRESVLQLWDLAAAATQDSSIGLVVGTSIRPTSYYALGLTFLTAENLYESLQRLTNYYRVIATVPLKLELVEKGDQVQMRVAYTDPDYPQPLIPFESFLASVVGLCRLARRPDFAPLQLRLAMPNNGRGADYQRLLGAPVAFDAPYNALVFNKLDLIAPLPGRSVDLSESSDRVLENYLAVLNPDQVSSEVRRLLLQMLPSGNVSQETISRKMNMSRSTLHRRLRQENTNYKELLESVRRTMAIEYVKDHTHSLSYIAFLLGFSDQSNFSRAFRRWTGQSPKNFRGPPEGLTEH